MKIESCDLNDKNSIPSINNKNFSLNGTGGGTFSDLCLDNDKMKETRSTLSYLDNYNDNLGYPVN
jgi:hypothetical protein